MLYKGNSPASPTAEVREALMRFRVGDIGAQGFSQNQRIHLLGHCTDLDAILWMVATIRAHVVPTDTDTPTEVVSTHLRGGYISSQPLPTMADMPLFPKR